MVKSCNDRLWFKRLSDYYLRVFSNYVDVKSLKLLLKFNEINSKI